MSVVVLEAEGLHTHYGKSHILHGVGLIVREGELVALLGRNGAGKSTSLRSLIGLTHPREGELHILGHATIRWPAYRIAALGVGYVPEGRRIFPNLTVEENLRVPIDRPGQWTIGRVYQLFPRLAERRRNTGRQLSGGEQEMLAIARVLLLNPRLLLLDEPSQGLAPLVVRDVLKVITTARNLGISVLLVEQNVRGRPSIPQTAPTCSTMDASSTRARPATSQRTSTSCDRSRAPVPKNGTRSLKSRTAKSLPQTD
jgi:branched-chain amino acid transport system ATP-binding protein